MIFMTTHHGKNWTNECPSTGKIYYNSWSHLIMELCVIKESGLDLYQMT